MKAQEICVAIESGCFEIEDLAKIQQSVTHALVVNRNSHLRELLTARRAVITNQAVPRNVRGMRVDVLKIFSTGRMTVRLPDGLETTIPSKLLKPFYESQTTNSQ